MFVTCFRSALNKKSSFNNNIHFVNKNKNNFKFLQAYSIIHNHQFSHKINKNFFRFEQKINYSTRMGDKSKYEGFQLQDPIRDKISPEQMGEFSKRKDLYEALKAFDEEGASPALGSNPVKINAMHIAQNSKHIRIDFDKVEEVAEKLHNVRLQGGFSLKTWKTHPLNPKIANEEALDWIFLVDTLNFSFWHRVENGVEQIYEVEWDGKKWTGYWALCAVIQRALHEGIPITSAEFMANVELPTLQHIFRSSNGVACPMIEKRKWAMNEAGLVLLDNFDGKFLNVVSSAEKSAKKLIEIILQNFSSYRDETFYSGAKVRFWKRVQILVADIWACFENEGEGHFYDIDFLSMFADYRVPQVLVHLGLMKYSDYLLDVLKNDPFLPPSSPLEVQIRGNSIFAVETLWSHMKILEEQWINEQLPDHLKDDAIEKEIGRVEAEIEAKKKVNNVNKDKNIDNEEEGVESALLIEREREEEKLKERLGPLNAVIIDFYLWDYAKRESEAMKSIPIHKTTTHFY